MNEERKMILKMLEEGTITSEEAAKLLDALDVSQEKPKRTETRGDERQSRHDGAERHSHGERFWDEEGRQRFRTSRRHGPFSADADFQFDFGDLKRGLKDVFENVGKSLHDAFGQWKEHGFEGIFEGESGAFHATREEEFSIPASDVQTITLRSGRGDISVRGDSSADEIRVMATLTAWAADQQAARERAEKAVIERAVEVDTVVLSSPCTPAAGPGSITHCKVDFEISAPNAVSLMIKCMSGDIEVEGITGRVDIKDLSGDVTATGVGEARIAAAAGDIKATHVEGDLKISSLSGDVTVEDAEGNVGADTKSGDVKIASCEGNVYARSVSGDIEIEECKGSVDARSVSGDVSLELPESACVSVSLKTVSGEIKCDLPLSDVTRTRQSLSGTLNDAEEEVSLSTTSGDISLSAT